MDVQVLLGLWLGVHGFGKENWFALKCKPSAELSHHGYNMMSY